MNLLESRLIKVISRFLVVTFVYVFVFKDYVYAKRYAEIKEEINMASIYNSIPLEYGQVLQSSIPSGYKKAPVVLINDLHANYQMQQNISNIIKYLNDNVGITKIGIEGSEGEIDTSMLDTIPDSEIRQKVSDYFMKHGLLTGAECFAALCEDSPKLVGLEDMDLYNRDTELLVASIEHRSSFVSYLQNIKQNLSIMEEKLLPTDLKKFKKQYIQYKNRQLKPAIFQKHLEEWAKRVDTSIGAISQEYARFIVLTKKQKKLDTKKVDSEYKALLKELDIDFEANDNKLKYAMSRVKNFFRTPESMRNQMVSRIYSDDTYSNLINYIDVLKLAKEIDQEKLLRDEKKIIEHISNSLCTDGTETSLVLIADYVQLLAKFLLNQITKEELDSFYAKAEEFGRKFEILKQQYPNEMAAIDNNFTLLNNYIGEMSLFYKIARERDAAFISNFIKKSDINNDKLIMVMGGFHSNGVAVKLKEMNIPYMVVSPRVTEHSSQDVKIYYRLLRGEETLDYAKLVSDTLALPSFLKMPWAQKRIAIRTLGELIRKDKNTAKALFDQWAAMNNEIAQKLENRIGFSLEEVFEKDDKLVFSLNLYDYDKGVEQIFINLNKDGSPEYISDQDVQADTWRRQADARIKRFYNAVNSNNAPVEIQGILKNITSSKENRDIRAVSVGLKPLSKIEVDEALAANLRDWLKNNVNVNLDIVKGVDGFYIYENVSMMRALGEVNGQFTDPKHRVFKLRQFRAEAANQISSVLTGQGKVINKDVSVINAYVNLNGIVGQLGPQESAIIAELVEGKEYKAPALYEEARKIARSKRRSFADTLRKISPYVLGGLVIAVPSILLAIGTMAALPASITAVLGVAIVAVTLMLRGRKAPIQEISLSAVQPKEFAEAPDKVLLTPDADRVQETVEAPAHVSAEDESVSEDEFQSKMPDEIEQLEVIEMPSETPDEVLFTREDQVLEMARAPAEKEVFDQQQDDEIIEVSQAPVIELIEPEQKLSLDGIQHLQLEDRVEVDERAPPAVSVIRQTLSEKGFRASSEDRDNYRNVFTRDAMWIGIAGILIGEIDLIEGLETTLNTIKDNQREDGMLPSSITPGGEAVYGRENTTRIDASLLYPIGVWQYYKATGDRVFLKKHIGAIEKALSNLSQKFGNTSNDLIYIPQAGDWADEYIQKGFVLYDEVLWFTALGDLAELLELTGDNEKALEYAGKARRVKDQIRENFWSEDGYFIHFFDSSDKATLDNPSDSFDAFGNALAMLSGISTDKQVDSQAAYIKSVRAEDTGLVPAHLPILEDAALDNTDLWLYSFKNMAGHYHNGGVWAWYSGILAAALAEKGKTTLASSIKESISEVNARVKDGKSYYEYHSNVKDEESVPSGTAYLGVSAAAQIIAEKAVDENNVLNLIPVLPEKEEVIELKAEITAAQPEREKIAKEALPVITKPVALIFEPAGWNLESMIAELGKDYEVRIVNSALTDNTIDNILADLELEGITADSIRVLVPFVGSKITESVLDKMPEVKIVASRSTGLDHIVKKEGILVSGVSDYGQNTVAEYAVALMLAIAGESKAGESVTPEQAGFNKLFNHARKLNTTREKVSRLDFSQDRGIDLSGKKLFIAGENTAIENIAAGIEMIITDNVSEADIVWGNISKIDQSDIRDSTIIINTGDPVDEAINVASENTGLDLVGKTIGVIGGGLIGLHTVKMAKAFGMKVIVNDLNIDQKLANDYGFTYADIDALLAESDVISLHVPLVAGTRGLISEEAISKMKEDVVVINTARGEIIDTQALMNGIEEGKVAGAGIDVVAGERKIFNKAFTQEEWQEGISSDQDIAAAAKLLSSPGVIVAPHNAFNTDEALTR
ncbi:NAD(P)-dependent oxidoreductase, partial [Elusimicrobiota bacterium]